MDKEEATNTVFMHTNGNIYVREAIKADIKAFCQARGIYGKPDGHDRHALELYVADVLKGIVHDMQPRYIEPDDLQKVDWKEIAAHKVEYYFKFARS